MIELLENKFLNGVEVKKYTPYILVLKDGTIANLTHDELVFAEQILKMAKASFKVISVVRNYENGERKNTN